MHCAASNLCGTECDSGGRVKGRRSVRLYYTKKSGKAHAKASSKGKHMCIDYSKTNGDAFLHGNHKTVMESQGGFPHFLVMRIRAQHVISRTASLSHSVIEHGCWGLLSEDI